MFNSLQGPFKIWEWVTHSELNSSNIRIRIKNICTSIHQIDDRQNLFLYQNHKFQDKQRNASYSFWFSLYKNVGCTFRTAKHTLCSFNTNLLDFPVFLISTAALEEIFYFVDSVLCFLATPKTVSCDPIFTLVSSHFQVKFITRSLSSTSKCAFLKFWWLYQGSHFVNSTCSWRSFIKN